MSERPIGKAHFVIAGTFFFGYLLYVGIRMRAGHDMPDGIYRPQLYRGPEFINGLADTYGSGVVGAGLIAFAAIGGILFGVWIWRTWRTW